MAEWLESLKAAGEWSNADSRLTALEKKTVLLPADGVAVNAMPTHNLFPRFKDLGTEITAAQYAAIANGSFNDLYIGDHWTIPLTILGEEKQCKLYIVQCGSGAIYREVNGERNWDYYTNCLHIMIYPSLSVKFNDTEDETGVTYAQSTVKNEVLPAILETLESHFGAEHILKWRFRSFLPDDNGVYEKINLFKLDEISYYQYSTPGRTEPYELFTHGILEYWGNPVRIDTLLQDTNGNNVYKYHWGTGFIMSQKQNQSYSIAPHFVLVP